MTLLPVSIVLLLIIVGSDVLSLRSTIGRGRRPVTSRVEVAGGCIAALALLVVGHELIAWTVLTVLPWFLLVAVTAATVGVGLTRVASLPWLPAERPIRTSANAATNAVLAVAFAAVLVA